MAGLYAFGALCLRLGKGGPLLRLRPGHADVGGDLPEVTLTAVDGRWRIVGDDVWASLAAASRPFPEKPSSGSIRSHLFIEVPDVTQGRPDHPALDVVAWCIEGSSGIDPTLQVTFEEGVPHGPFTGWTQQTQPRKVGWFVEPAFAGTVWIQHGDARLALGVFPRNLVSAADVRAATRGEGGHAPVSSALRRLDGIVRDLWDHAAKMKPPAEPTPGISVRSGEQEKSWFQQLARLHDLVVHRGVRDAWQAMAADPVVRLVTEFPVVPVSRARVPVVHGARGPWTLPRGWSPDRPDGDLRERVVTRTVDTPPNRLAVGLAARVLEAIDQLLGDAPKDATSKAPDERVLGMVEPIRQAAMDALNTPVFREVNPYAPLALDSPSLQANVRCRPLLDAWYQLTQGVAPNDPMRLDDLMIEPLAKAHELYERWCFLALSHAVASVVERPMGEVKPDGEVLFCEVKGADVTVTVYHAADGASVASSYADDEEEEDDDEAIAKRKRKTAPDNATWRQLTNSWSPVSRPDGFLLIERGSVTTVHAWDAKYRPLRNNESRDAGFLYQAHAFRDAISWTNPALRLTWSLVLHPGVGQRAIVGDAYVNGTPGGNGANRVTPIKIGCATKNETANVLTKAGGVAIVAVTPPVTDGAGTDLDTLQRVIRDLIATF
jgi:hypothetical protein